MFKIALTTFLTLAIVSPVMATSGPGCLVVVNVARNDALNMRARPSANARIVDVLRRRRTASSISTQRAGRQASPGRAAGAR